MSDVLRDLGIALNEAKAAVDYSDPASIDRWLRADWNLHAAIQRANHRPEPAPYVPYDWPEARAARAEFSTRTE